MLFNSLIFLVFMAAVLLVYPRLRHRAQNRFLLLASYVFYGYWDWRFLSLLLASTVTDYLVGSALHRSEGEGRRRRLLLVSVVVNLGILGFFKYFDFFTHSLVGVLERSGLNPNAPLLNVVLPVGISFYTFQTLSYTIDIYRRKLEPTRDFLDFALFVSFFPQLVAGPIERARNLLPQVARPREVTPWHVSTGLNLVLVGFFKKIAIADTLAPIVNSAFGDPAAHGAGHLLCGLYAFCFQIYGDFSGYSDIARGVSRLLGFELMENFAAPYLSRGPAEFWRRWHISLSSWLRDYLYIPLGGNRGGTARTYRNLMLTMLLGGLWHGANWTFVVWGLLHGLYLVGYRLAGGGGADMEWPVEPRRRVAEGLKMILFFHLVALTWIPFRSPDFATAWQMLTGILSLRGILDLGPLHVLVAGAAMFALDVAQTRARSQTWLAEAAPGRRYVLANLMLAATLAAAAFRVYSNPAFIYFQF